MLSRSRSRSRRSKQLADASCVASSRFMRGGIGFAVGGMIGGMIGGGIMLAVVAQQTNGIFATVTNAPTIASTTETMGLVAMGLGLVGAMGGAAIGAYKPEC